MSYIFFLLLLTCTTLYPMDKAVSFSSAHRAFDKKSDLRLFTEAAQYGEKRDRLIIKNQQNTLNSELLHLDCNVQPEDKTEFANRYIQYRLVPAMHTGTISTIGTKITQFGPQIRNAILNSERFPEIQPYLLLAALGTDVRKHLLVDNYFNGDESAIKIFENLPCLQALKELSVYEKKPKPTMFFSDEIWNLSHDQLKVCDYIEQVIKSNPIPPVPLSHSQEKIVQNLPFPIVSKSIFRNQSFACQLPTKDVLKNALTETDNQRNIIIYTNVYNITCGNCSSSSAQCL